MGIKFSIELEGLDKGETFENFLRDLPVFMGKKGIKISSNSETSIVENGTLIGTLREVVPPDYIIFDWNTSATWDKSDNSTFKIEFHSDQKKNQITISVSSEDWGTALSDKGQSTLEWFTDEIIATFFSTIGPDKFSNWLLDARARSPTGTMARLTYADPLFHWPNFRKILSDLKLTRDDNFLEIACGGGAFLREALKSGCNASAIDHSLDMVNLAKEQNSKSIKSGKLKIKLADALNIPFQSDTFTAAVCTGAFNFIPDPMKFMNEAFRVLKKGGRLILFTGSKELKGTPASPEPIGSMINYYEDQELQEFAEKAGFSNVSVLRPSLEKYALESDLPDEIVEFFKQPGGGGQFLYATKS